jgi:hypothetical protein
MKTRTIHHLLIINLPRRNIIYSFPIRHTKTRISNHIFHQIMRNKRDNVYKKKETASGEFFLLYKIRTKHKQVQV